MYFLYDCLQLLFLLFLLPKIVWQRVFYGRFKNCFAFYFSLSLPKVKPKKGTVYLIYAVSMGETKAAYSLFHKMKQACHEDQFYIISRTSTGHSEAKKIMEAADGHFFMPIDFSWGMKRFLKRLKPDVVIVVENDFWLNFLRISRSVGAFVVLVSGKVSLRSFHRFQTFSFFSGRLFSCFNLICAQSDLFRKRFIDLGVDPSNVCITGDLKCDTSFEKIDTEELKRKLGIQKKDRVLVVASTHFQEEEAVLKALHPLWEKIPHLKLVIVPRHPERFLEVEGMLQKQAIPVISYSLIGQKTGSEQIILVDAMGMLLSIYQIAELAIVGGSFFKRLKGHNIFEPIQVGVPVLFGPYMGDQRGLVESVLLAKAGRQACLKDLFFHVEELLQDLSLYQEMQKQGAVLLQQMKGSSSRTWESICEKKAEFKKELFEI